MHCSMLAEDAIKSAIRDYQSKRSPKTPILGTNALNAGPESPMAQVPT